MTLTAQPLASTPVLKVATLPAPNESVGYLLFNDHIATAEGQLVAAIDTLKAAAVTDLVLDLRYNGGGYLDIAAELAYMIAGPANTGGKFFERLNYNNRDPFNQSLSERTTAVLQRDPGLRRRPSGQTLPDLGLSRVFVLTSADTCSASEAIVNGLRGAGVTVHLVGGTTCGKPYGFYPRRQLRHHLLRDPVPGRQLPRLRRLRRRLRPDLHRGRRLQPRPRRPGREPARSGARAAQHRDVHRADEHAGAGARHREKDRFGAGAETDPERENRIYRQR